jgi:hypothetical protein
MTVEITLKQRNHRTLKKSRKDLTERLDRKAKASYKAAKSTHRDVDEDYDINTWM